MISMITEKIIVKFIIIKCILEDSRLAYINNEKLQQSNDQLQWLQKK